MPANTIQDIDTLEEAISRPTPQAIQMLADIPGDIIILGAGGKMGPSLSRMAKRASDEAKTDRRIIAVSRYSNRTQADYLNSVGVETIPCDLTNENALDALPDAPNIIYMVGMKFGSTGNEPLTWAMNTYLPGRVCERYKKSRIVAFSTGNIYGLTPVTRGGSIETDTVNPLGEYAQSCLGRERILAHFAKTNGTPIAINRLNYAVEMRYGVLVDIAAKIAKNEPIDLAIGSANVIWQGDANDMILRTLAHAGADPFTINITGPETISIRRAAEQLGTLIGREPIFTGEETDQALLSNAQKAHALLGYPRVSVQQIIEWIADWTKQGGELLGKPTHYEARDGRY